MKVVLAAHTQVLSREAFPAMEWDMDATHMEFLVEAAGRQCYESFHKPNSKTRANRDYIANILEQGHESVLEHASVTFRVTGVSRNLLLELERHRHLSFSVISQRYVDSSKAEFVIPPVLRDAVKKVDPEQDFDLLDIGDGADQLIEDSRSIYEDIVIALTKRGVKRKQAREAARSVLPGGVETKFLVTGNLRAWRDVIKKRWSVHADAEICALAGEILTQLRKVAPNAFQDFSEVPFA